MPDLVEEAVFRVVRAWVPPELAREHDREREAIYGSPPAERPDRFRALAERWWERLGLDRPVRDALLLCPALRRAGGSAHVRRVALPGDEGSELFASETPAAAPVRAVLQVRVDRFADLDGLRRFALEELLILDDMLDPAFGYRLQLPQEAADPPLRDAVLARLRELWKLRASGRAGDLLQLDEPPPAPTPEFQAAFGDPAADPRLERMRLDAWSGRLATYAALLQRALAPPAAT